MATWLLPTSAGLPVLHQQSFVTSDGSLRPKTGIAGSHPGSQARECDLLANETPVPDKLKGAFQPPSVIWFQPTIAGAWGLAHTPSEGFAFHRTGGVQRFQLAISLYGSPLIQKQDR